MSDAAQPAADPAVTPMAPRAALLHAAVVAITWALGDAAAAGVAWLVPTFRDPVVSLEVVAVVRWALLMGIGATLTPQVRWRYGRSKAAVASAVIAAFVMLVNLASALSDGTEGLFGASSDDILIALVDGLKRLDMHVWIAGVAVGLFLGAARCGRRTEGLGMVLPVEAAHGFTALVLYGSDLPSLIISVTVTVITVSFALPLLSRASQRLLVSEEVIS